ncbi:metal cation transporting P-type ATPase ctpF [Mycobacterium tuberculosis]|nr:metal cation transporting P-type ATPase ctpF [Mycobacterium tuberculosis]
MLARILRQFHHPLIYVLLVAGTITAGLKESRVTSTQCHPKSWFPVTLCC